MKLNLKNFRSHHKFDLDLEPITVIIGPNGVGKTNILEAISFLSAARSFRVDDKVNLIKLEADFAKIQLDSFEAIISRTPRVTATFKINGVKKKLVDFIGLLPSVVFNPESLQIITAGPVERRRFMDSLLSQTSKEYLRALVDLKQVLSRRNRLLSLISEGRAAVVELDFWDQKMIDSAKIIIKEREKFVEFLNKKLPSYYQKIATKDEPLNVKYKAQLNDPSVEKLLSKRPIEIAAGTTIYGPHRDDLIFQLSGVEASNFASRGETRSIVLALKLAEIEYLDKYNQHKRSKDDTIKPVLLLDDVFSELDEQHRDHIYDLIRKYQAVITTTDLDHLSKELLSHANLVELS